MENGAGMKAGIPVRKHLTAVRGIGERDWGFGKKGALHGIQMY